MVSCPTTLVLCMRPPPITRERCVEQALAAREKAASAPNERERVRLIHVAVAYEGLAAKAR